MAKSYRTAFIRVTAENETEHDGLVLYTLADIENSMKDWAESAGITYWLIEHTADDEVSRTHFHIVIKFKSPMPFEPIKNKFPYGMIESARNIKAAIQYLIHLNDGSKVPYNWEDIRTNCKDMTPYKVLSISQQEVNIQGVIDAIKSGEIKEYNQFEKIPNEIWAKYRTRIENSLLFEREKIYMNKDRNINVIFLSGPTGVGKTTFAKNYCDANNKVPCISSASNDPLQDYKGQDVLILDDMRDDVFKFHDLLKFLDNHTKSTGKSRYHNKAFIGDTIIITSPKPVIDWYFNSMPEDKRQLYRRIRSWFKFTTEKIEAFEYDDKLCRYEKVASMPNYITMSIREQAKLALNVLDSMGLEFTPTARATIEDTLKNKTDEELKQVFADTRQSFIAEATEEETEARKEYEASLPPINWENVKKHQIA